MRKTPIISLLFAGVLLALLGCDGQGQRMMELQQDIALLQTENARLKDQAEQYRIERDNARIEAASLARMTPDQWAKVPRASRIDIDRFTSLHDGRPQVGEVATTQPADGSGDGHFVRLYLIAYDQDGFRIRPAATIQVRLFDLSGESARSLGTFDFDVEETFKHYRSRLGSDMFAFDLPLSAEPGSGGVTVQVKLTDLLSGNTLEAQKLLEPQS